MIHTDPSDEAMRILAAAHAKGVTLRIMGGVAIALHADGHLPQALQRTYADIDVVTAKKQGRHAIALLQSLGYEANERFNSLNASHRAVVYDAAAQRQIDVFIGEFEMCHRVPIAARLDIDDRTVPLAELLITKLQIIQINLKDLVDIVALLATHDIADHDADAVNVTFIAQLLATDWGLWRTCTRSLETASVRVGVLGLDAATATRVQERIQILLERVEAEPKSLKWRSRAKIGERKKWYADPEEIEHPDLSPLGGHPRQPVALA